MADELPEAAAKVYDDFGIELLVDRNNRLLVIFDFTEYPVKLLWIHCLVVRLFGVAIKHGHDSRLLLGSQIVVLIEKGFLFFR